ncbi:rapid alkalinization factor 23-like [Rhodamnia argentea]|uniref:Rapid alkalinization factor 23-like n=1 Tax=Rhodamnia argentea TaxID=178133 RepID=A0A8B8QWB5_9MYRT|nr:rapid alkalinization factor 23-like [Rhodamnia argentea]
MRKTTGAVQLFRGLLILAVCLAPSARASAFSPLDFAAVMPYSAGECRGSIAECLAAGAGDGEWGEELAMDSETNRRILATTRYISYGALRRNTVPCSRRGVSYYNCRTGAPANPYTRACSRITRCRG